MSDTDLIGRIQAAMDPSCPWGNRELARRMTADGVPVTESAIRKWRTGASRPQRRAQTWLLRALLTHAASLSAVSTDARQSLKADLRLALDALEAWPCDAHPLAPLLGQRTDRYLSWACPQYGMSRGQIQRLRLSHGVPALVRASVLRDKCTTVGARRSGSMLDLQLRLDCLDRGIDSSGSPEAMAARLGYPDLALY